MSLEKRFRLRLNEVSAYLRSLRDLERRHGQPGRGFYRASAALAASRASAFIMIYNCVEFAARESIVAVREEIGANGAAYTDLQVYWRDEIIKVHFKDRLEQGTNHIQLLKDFGQFVPGQVTWLHRARELPFSGNIDHKLLIDFARKIGDRRWCPPKNCLGGSDLELIKKTRNDLAHGDETFENIGVQYNTRDIIEKLSRIRIFMCSFVKMTKRYGDARLYLQPSP